LQNLFAQIRGALSNRPTVISAISALAAMLLVSGYIKRRENTLLHMAAPMMVVTANRDINAGDIIDASSIDLTTVPRRFVQPDAILKKKNAISRIARIAIPRGTRITSSMAETVRRDDIASILPDGMRGVKLRLKEIPDFIHEGNSVDILATFELSSDGERKATTITILNNVYVVSTSSSYKSSNLKSKSRTSLITTSPYVGRVKPYVVLAVSPSDAQKIIYAEEMGNISVSVRPMGNRIVKGKSLKPTTIGSFTKNFEELAPRRKSFNEYKGRL